MQTDYQFEELPLATSEGGWTGAYADGVADIDYFRDGTWKVAAIKLRLGQHKPGRSPVHKLFPAPKPIAQVVELTLLSDPQWRRWVQERVDEALRADASGVRDIEDHGVRGAYRRQVEV